MIRSGLEAILEVVWETGWWRKVTLDGVCHHLAQQGAKGLPKSINLAPSCPKIEKNDVQARVLKNTIFSAKFYAKI